MSIQADLLRRQRCRKLLAAAAIAVAILPAGALAQDRQGCSVERIRGPATVLRDGTSLPLNRGMALRQDDQIVTGRKARIRIGCPGGADITIGPQSSLSLREIAGTGATGSLLLDLVQGILRSALAPDVIRERFEVRTPLAVAAARSTEWVTEAQPDNAAVFVIEGSVAVSSRDTGDTVLVSAGRGTDVKPNAAPTPPAPWGQPRIDSALSRTSMP